jgi:regulator of protease activity HflC (stomatin/prohibitin superfamily)
MSEPTAETKDRIKEAAKLRIEGASWAVIATKYGYSDGDSARKMLAGMYPELWRGEYEKARELYLDEMEAEAVLTQRALMRPFRTVRKPDGTEVVQTLEPQLNQSAAHSILAHAARLRSQKIEVKGEVRHSGQIAPMTPEQAIAALREAHEKHQAQQAEDEQAHQPEGKQAQQTEGQQAVASLTEEAPEGDQA